MNRFNFRAWDKKKKELFPVHELQWHKISNETEKIVGYDDWDKDGYTYHGGGIMSYARENRYILEQCTGLNDKNSNPVYEGDLCKDSAGDIFKVLYNTTHCGFLAQYIKSAPEKKQGCWRLGDKISDKIEVIGNIHENPELLEVA